MRLRILLPALVRSQKEVASFAPPLFLCLALNLWCTSSHLAADQRNAGSEKHVTAITGRKRSGLAELGQRGLEEA
jgi:hypothetical protein